jgi:hypothetical protein
MSEGEFMAEAPGPDRSLAIKKLDSLTRTVACLEHTMLVTYLYAAYSVRETYREISGWGGSPLGANLFGVALQEMQHLHAVNLLRRALRLPPHLARWRLPFYDPTIYPFVIGLERLSRACAWKYAFIEAPLASRDATFHELPVEVRGSNPLLPAPLYYTQIHEAIASLDENELPGKPAWLRKVDRVRQDGDHDHFEFFRALALKSHPAFARRPPASWNPTADTNPSIELRGPEGGEVDLVRLADLLYWLSGVLLHGTYLHDGWLGQPDEEYDGRKRPLYQQARAVMSQLLWPYGRFLADRGLGLSFPVSGEGASIGREGLPVERGRLPDDLAALKALVRQYAAEAEGLAAQLARVGDMPDTVDRSVLRALIRP